MPKDLSREQVNTGKVIFDWQFKEYNQYDRSKRWYLIMLGFGLLFVVYALWTADYLFALIIILFGIVLYVHEMQTPIDVYFAITETGVIIGRKFYKFSEVTEFWIIYAPPDVKNLYLRFDNVARHRLRIPLLDFDPRPIRDYIGKFVREDLAEEEEPLSDRLARVLKIH